MRTNILKGVVTFVEMVFSAPTSCNLYAIYLPCKINDLPALVQKETSS